MKKKNLWLLVPAALSLVLAFVPGVSGSILGALALPFTALGWLLRTMSLSGGVGNAAAIAVYAAVCCIPLVFWWRSRRRPEDWLLVLLSGVTALVLYYMINPGMRYSLLQDETGDVVYSFAFWSTIITWGVLKLLGSSEQILENNIFRALRIFLLICAASCTIKVFGTNLAWLFSKFERYSAMEYGSGFKKLPTYVFLILDYAVMAVENGLTALVLYKGTTLLEALEADPFGEDCVKAAGEVSRWCKQTMVIVNLTSLALNIGLLLMADMILDISMEVRVPVWGMAVAFGMLALTRLLTQGKELKDDNDLFI